MSALLAFSGPHSHGPLTLWVLRGADTDARTFTTLDAGLAESDVHVREMKSARVDTLAVENTSDRWLFIQAGQVVRGGKQDRAFASDIILPPRSAEVRVPSYCVEHGRWNGGKSFTSTTGLVSGSGLRGTIQRSVDQGRVWESVAASNTTATKRVSGKEMPFGPPPPKSGTRSFRRDPADAAKDLESYIALARSGAYAAIYELPDVKDFSKAALASVMPAVNACPDGRGLVAALHNEMYGADVYAQNELFWKLRHRLVEAWALEAFLAPAPKKALPVPTEDGVRAFLETPLQGNPKKDTIAGSTIQVRRTAGGVTQFQYGDDQEPSVHSCSMLA